MTKVQGLTFEVRSLWAVHAWLQKYQYRIELSWWVFALTALGALFITLITEATRLSKLR